MLQSVEMAELLNQKEAKPMLGIGLDYIAVSERTDMDVMDNGKDILMPMVSVSIPLFNKKYRSQTKQNKLQLQEIGAKKQERMNVLVSAYDMALKNRVSAVINFNTQTKNLKQARNAEEILLKSYQTGTINFNDVLDIQELQLKFQTNQIESIKDYHIQTTIINYLLK
jgi:outer membrane protein TolC